jgi:hypothetical protein
MSGNGEAKHLGSLPALAAAVGFKPAEIKAKIKLNAV